MSNAEQCPSTIKSKPKAKDRAHVERSDATGKRYWRSVEDARDEPEFREWLEREFPAHASELTEESRRDFLRIMGASLALAGAATIPGCRRPDHKILAYNRQPEDLVVGNPLYYATAIPTPGGGAQGVLARTIDGRPIKLEGNPLHPLNKGRTDALVQASILDLYDPDRSKEVLRNGEPIEGGWRAFESFARTHFADAGRGQGVAFIVEKMSSPSLSRMRSRILNRWPEARWVPHEALDAENTLAGAAIAFGAPHRTRHHLAKANVVVTLEHDFLTRAGGVEETHGFAQGRRVHTKAGESASARMSRLYAIESNMSLTGGAADHRLRVDLADMPRAAMELARVIATKAEGASALASVLASYEPTPDRAEFFDALADDLVDRANRGRAVVMVGESLPPEVHAVYHAINAALGAVGETVTHLPVEGWLAESSVSAIRTLCDDIDAGRVHTVVVVGANPVYTAPADLDFASRYAKVRTRVHLGLNVDETAAASTWHINRAHWLESWGDIAADDGTVSAIQPMIAPIFNGKTELELLAAVMGEEADAYEIVRAGWQDMLSLSDDELERRWRRALHDGVLQGSAPRVREVRVNAGAVRSAIGRFDAGEPSGEGAFNVLFQRDPRLHDGRFANNGWLQESPHPVTKVTWDNPVFISSGAAKRLGISVRPRQGRRATLSLGGREIDVALWVQPGLADDALVVTLGGGRERVGRVGAGVGFNTYALRTSEALAVGRGATLTLLRGSHPIACVQDHHAMEGRPIAREFDVQAFRKWGDKILEEKDSYGFTRRLNFAQRAGTEAHTPVNREAYLPSQAHGFSTINPDGTPRTPPNALGNKIWEQWGMSIDLSMCTGCGACITACQAENNIPIVGKSEVLVGREMHWIRVDRYFGSNIAEHESDPTADPNPDMLVQPVPCMHCENAPCEVVCPVNATAHGPGGTNDMAYNRCIGTRYCSNNCPYKVRRFNWFDYATKQFKGGFGQLAEGVSDSLMPANQHWVPPRLRAKVSELQTMQHNPNVTVRSRGVMEKCTYCMQRINRAKVETKLQDLDRVPDGFFQVACQQACPAEAIVFGDIADESAGVTFLREHPRSYMMLAYLNARPRTTYMARLRNPNPRLRTPNEDPFDHHGHTDDESAGLPVRTEENGSPVVSLPVLSDAGRRAAMASLISGVL